MKLPELPISSSAPGNEGKDPTTFFPITGQSESGILARRGAADRRMAPGSRLPAFSRIWWPSWWHAGAIGYTELNLAAGSAVRIASIRMRLVSSSNSAKSIAAAATASGNQNE